MEQTIIKGSPKGAKVIPIVFIIVGIALFLVTTIIALNVAVSTVLGLFEIVFSIILIVVGIILWFYFGKCEITVTDKRIYGKAAFGKRVDLPMDSISAVGMTGLFKGIVVSSSSGAIKFWYIDNADKIHKAISKLLIERQGVRTEPKVAASNAEELKQYKELLDQGVISLEEFEAKKKQLLGL